VRRAPGTIAGIAALRNNALKAKLAGVREHVGPFSSMCSLNRSPGAARASTEASCFAHDKRIAPQIIAVEDQVEVPT
jgi:hypothetical protein